MKKLIIFLFFFSVQILGQSYLVVTYDNSDPENSTDISTLRKITFSADACTFMLTDNSTVSKDFSIIRKITFNEVDGGNPLPVELVSFIANAEDGKVVLNWSTATEVNNYGFEIQRLQDCKIERLQDSGDQLSVICNQWEKIGFVEGHGNSNSPKEYSFGDENPPAGNIQYRLKQIDTDGNYEYFTQIAEVNFSITSVEEKQLPKEFELSQNYPNPFNPTTKIQYAIPTPLSLKIGSGGEVGTAVHVTLNIYDILGNEVATLVNEQKQPGYYQAVFNGSSFSAGVYIYRISATGEAGSFTASKKLILIK